MLKAGWLMSVAALCIFAACQIAGAAIITDAYTLDYIVNNLNNELVVGDKVFSDFSIVSTALGAVAPDLGAISVQGVYVDGHYGLKFNAGWAAGPGQIVDTTMSFAVAATQPDHIKGVLLWMTSCNAAGSGVVMITEEIYEFDPSKSISMPIGENFVYSATGMQQRFDETYFEPLSKAYVVKDIYVSGGAEGVAGVSEFYQLFSQVPEPGTLGLLCAGFALLWRKRRI